MANTKLAISNKTGQVLTINTLPNYSHFDDSGWVAMLCDEGKTTTSDPTPTGDYSYKAFCTIDRTAKTLTFAGGVDLSAWTVGDNLVLYNAFLNYDFVGDQTSNPLISISGAPAWRGYYTIGGGMFRHSDGRFIWMFTGSTTASGHAGAIGYASSPDMINWTIGNSGASIVEYGDVADCKSISTTGSINSDGAGGYYCLVLCLRTSNGKNSTRIMYFDEDFSSITFSSPILDESAYYGAVGSCIIKIGNYYHISYSQQLQHDYDREQRVAKSLYLEGPYVDYQTIAIGTGSNDGVQWSWSADGISIFNDGVHIFGLFGGFSKWSQSGGKGNRYFCLFTYNESTGLWVIDRKGPVIINPLYYQNLPGGYYNWADDHCGGYPSLFVDGTDKYMSLTMKGSVYQAALIKLKI
jgi:hypothetical protein